MAEQNNELKLPPITEPSAAAAKAADVAADAARAAELDGFTGDYDDALRSETQAARQRPLAEFGGDPDLAAQRAAVEDSVPVEDVTTRRAEPQAAADASPAVEPQGQTAPKTDAAPAAKPDATPSSEAKPQEQPAERAALAGDEAISLVDQGDQRFSLTREQIVRGLQERNGYKAAYDRFASVFGADVERVVEGWSPVIAMLSDPQDGAPRTQFLDTMLQVATDPAKRAYLEKAAAFFDGERANGGAPPAPAAPVQPQVDPEKEQMRRDLDRLRLENAARAVGAEKSAALQRYPKLADERLAQIVAMHAHAKITAGDDAYTYTRAVEDLKSVIERWGDAEPVQPEQKVPALNRASGAAPSGSAKVIDFKPKRFASTDDAIADFETNVAPLLT